MRCRHQCPNAAARGESSRFSPGVASLIFSAPVMVLMIKFGIEPWLALAAVSVGTVCAIARGTPRSPSCGRCCHCRNQAAQPAAVRDLPSWDYEPIPSRPKRRPVWPWAVAAWLVAFALSA